MSLPNGSASLPKINFELNDEVEHEVIFGDVRYIFPALDINPHSTLMVSVALPTIKRITQKKGHVKEIPSIELYVVNDKREIFPCVIEAFMERGLFARIPIVMFQNRWSAPKIYEYLQGKAPEPNPYEVLLKIRERFNNYMDFTNNQDADVFASVYTIATYFYFLFQYFPYLKIGGTKGTGKTKFGTIFACLAFNGDMSSSDTAPTIFRFAQDTRGTMVIDEQEGLSDKSEEYLAYRQILLAGFNVMGKARRTNPETRNIEAFSAYSPKVICAISGLEETLEDRAFEIILQKSIKHDIESHQPKEASPEWQLIRNDLYLVLLQKWTELKSIADDMESPSSYITGRIWDLATPLVSISRFLDKYAPEGYKFIEKTIVDFIIQQVKRKQESAAESEGGTVLVALKNILSEEKESSDTYKFSVKLKEVAEVWAKMEGWEKIPSSKKVSRILKNFKLYEKPIRKPHDGSYCFTISRADLKTVMQTYGLVGEDGDGSEGSEGKKHPPLFPEVRQSTNNSSTEKTIGSLGPSPPSLDSPSSPPDSKEGVVLFSESSPKEEDKLTKSITWTCPGCRAGPFTESAKVVKEHQKFCQEYKEYTTRQGLRNE